MHQTFYIDIDEEITSIIDRIKKSRVNEVVIVVPKRALLIQGIVNLKLLKKESERLKKEITVVTQDEQGKLMLEKLGILSEQRLDDILGKEIISQENSNNVIEKGLESDAILDGENKRERLDNLGSGEYFDIQSSLGAARKSEALPGSETNNPDLKNNGEKITNKELVSDISINIKKGGGLHKPLPFSAAKEPALSILGGSESNRKKLMAYNYGQNFLTKAGKKDMEKENDKGAEKENSNIGKLTSFFESPVESGAKKEQSACKSAHISGGIKKKFLLFSIIVFIAIAVSAVYLFAPKAEIKIFLKTKTKAVDLEIKGAEKNSAVSFENGNIPAKVIEASETIERKFDATGGKVSSNQRAKGTITVYNEYSGSPQPLVATTRFVSEDGKIFRLVKSITVPGTTVAGGKTEPGIIEAEVAADEAGESFNIGPSKFSIPGFQGSGAEKYSKIYGKSLKPMIGGGNGKETTKIVSAADISAAKNKLLAELDQAIRKKIKESAGEEYAVLDDAINISDAAYTLSDSEGAPVSSFNASVRANAKALIFAEKDIRDFAAKAIAASSKNGANKEINPADIKLQFGKLDANFSDNSALIRANASGEIIPDMDAESLKKGFLGKSEDDLLAYLKEFSEINSVEVSYWPIFMEGKIPSYESRVGVTFDTAPTAAR